ncbi:unnamed protein product [Owenia fusiformis]|uniref:Uncharacterized protein n=1 Tax=Owenia fusiformis TaxID=6347 RepID=A0A8J1UKP8_OWEFU|nr:unnamed protein product [Owenia fusiformis]
MMAGQVKQVESDSHFQPELASAESSLVVVDFYATWCGPCQRITPVYVELSQKYPKAVFLKVDVDQCPDTASAHGVTAMPTFLFFRNKAKIDMLRGADVNLLEEKIKKWYGDEDEGDEGETVVKGHMDLGTFINKAGCECLNEADDHPLTHALTTKGGYLESDCDAQLIINIEFNQAMKLHSLKLYGPPGKAPKNIKIFTNQPSTLDFDQAESMEPVESKELTEADVATNSLIPLRYVKYQNVLSCTIFIKDNQEGGEVTQVDYIGLIGSAVQTTNMGEFKRVAGKKGESH